MLLLPHWSGALVTRTETGGETTTHGARHLGEAHIIKKNRLSTSLVRLIRFRNHFTGYRLRMAFSGSNSAQSRSL